MKPDIEKIGSQPDTFLAPDVDSPIISELQIRSKNRIKTSVNAPQLDDTNVPVTQTSHSIPNNGEELFSVPISYGASEKQIQALVPCPCDQRKNTPPKLTWTRLLRTPTSACMDISVGQKTVGAKRSMTLMIMETDYRPKWQTSGSRSWRTLYKPQYQQRRLMLGPAEHNDRLKLELPRAWELPGS